MKILITGAAGFLGRNFARYHLANGDRVHGLDDMSSPHARWLEGWENCVVGDAGRFFDGWDEGIRNDYDLVYHFAAPVGGREKIEGDPLFNAGSLRLDASLFRWATAHGRRSTIVYPSSSAVYGVTLQEREGTALREVYFNPGSNTFPRPDEMYGITKMVGETLAYAADTYGVDTLCIRPFSGYGEDQGLDYPVPAICKRVAKHNDPLTVWGSGHQSRDFIHVDDVVGATVARLEAGVEGYVAMNIGTGTPMTFNRLATIAAGIEGYHPVIENKEDRPQGVHARYCDPTEMLKYYTPKVTLAEGLKRVIAVYA